MARQSEICRILMTTPGVGTLTALAYMSSTTFSSNPSFAWAIVFTNGIVAEGDKSVSDFSYVRAVRGRQTSNDFFDNGDGTVINTDIGLIWQKDTAPGIYNWQQALSYCENLILNNDGESSDNFPFFSS